MKALYIDCGMGAAGDMLCGALLELIPDAKAFIGELNAVGIPGVEYQAEPFEKCKIKGTHVSVRIYGSIEGEDEPEHVHHHSGLSETEHIIEGLNIPEKIKKDILGVYNLLAAVESEVHGVPVSDIHFHEVGTLDAIADITAVCMLMDRLAPDAVFASAVHVGSGSVKCAHGILPVPAPATALLLKGVPVYGGNIEGELCTPTGAALLKYYVSRFGQMPVMEIEKIGYGMGMKNFERANCVRAFLGHTSDVSDRIAQLSCNVDDMTAEEIGFAMDRLFEGGAKEVFTVPAGMKKNRPGTMICVICSREDEDRMARLLFKHTSTIGVRVSEMERFIMDRELETLHTKYGDVRVKKSGGYGIKRSKYEYDDVVAIAKREDISFRKAGELIRKEEENE